MITEHTAILKVRVRRATPALAGMFYHLNVGDKVFGCRISGETARVCDVEDPAKRIASDYFSVPVECIEIIS